MSLSLAQIRRFLGSERVTQLRRLQQTIPPGQRQDLLVGLDELEPDLRSLSRYESVLADWAEGQAKREGQNRRIKLAVAEGTVAELAARITGLYQDAGFRFDANTTPEALHGSWVQLTDEVDRHVRDKKNLGPTKREKTVHEIQAMGAVSIEESPDPLIEAAREIREGLTKLRIAEAEVVERAGMVNVDPVELDSDWAEWISELERTHGPTVPNPTDPNSRPALDREVEARLRGWGIDQPKT